MTHSHIYPEIDKGRLAVIENIARAVEDGDLFRKVEIGDPAPTDEDIKRVVVPFDNLRKNPVKRMLAWVATRLADSQAKKMADAVKIEGWENLAGLTGGFIMTSNHYNPIDSLPPRLSLLKHGKGRGLHIVVQESNLFMDGFFGFLMKNCNTLPVSRNLGYMSRNLKPSIGTLLDKGEVVLVYPEAEMWFNYKKPREYMDGAYYYAVEFDKPILPCFTTFEANEEYGDDGLHTLKYTFHIMPPIYPDATLPKRERRQKMKDADAAAKRECYLRAYGKEPEADFRPERDIAGFPSGAIVN